MSLCLGHPQPHPCGHAWISTPTALWLCLGLTPCGMPGPPTTTALSFYVLLPPCVYAWATTTVLWLCLGHPPPQPYSPLALPGLISTAVSLCLGHALPQPCSNASAHSPTTQPWLCLRHYHSSVAASPTATALWLCLVYRLPQPYGHASCSHYHSLVPMPGHI